MLRFFSCRTFSWHCRLWLPLCMPVRYVQYIHFPCTLFQIIFPLSNESLYHGVGYFYKHQPSVTAPSDKCVVGDWGEWSQCKSPRHSCHTSDPRSRHMTEQEKQLQTGQQRPTFFIISHRPEPVALCPWQRYML